MLLRPAAWFLASCCLALASIAERVPAQQADAFAVWTVIIPDGFPANIYTWRLSPDGSYEEDAVSTMSGKRAQPTLSGCCIRDGQQMVLRQRGLDFVFAGVMTDRDYSGTLFLNDQPYSRFCATRGDSPPGACDAKLETNAPQLTCAAKIS